MIVVDTSALLAIALCDCFAYALAKQQGCPLLYVGEDFAQTDIAAALSG